MIFTWEAKYVKRCDTPKTFISPTHLQGYTESRFYFCSKVCTQSLLIFKKIIIKIIVSIFADDKIKICQCNTNVHFCVPNRCHLYTVIYFDFVLYNCFNTNVVLLLNLWGCGVIVVQKMYFSIRDWGHWLPMNYFWLYRKINVYIIVTQLSVRVTFNVCHYLV